MQNLVRPNKLLADAVDARQVVFLSRLLLITVCISVFIRLLIGYLCQFLQEIDLRIGASFTRFQTMLLKDAFVLDFLETDRNLVLSYGPCQVMKHLVSEVQVFLVLVTDMNVFLSSVFSFQP